MRTTGCENCLFKNSCTQSEKNLGTCDDYFNIHELSDDDWETEDENEWAAILWFSYLDKDILEDDLLKIDLKVLSQPTSISIKEQTAYAIINKDMFEVIKPNLPARSRANIKLETLLEYLEGGQGSEV